MRIVIDLQGAQGESRNRGIGRYSLDLAVAIAKARGNHEVVIALNGAFPESVEDIRLVFSEILPETGVRVWDGLTGVSWRNNLNSERRKQGELIREVFLESLEPDFLLVTSLFEGFSDDVVTSINSISNVKTIVILYDLIPLIRKEVYLNDVGLYNYYLEKIEHLKRADHLLSISGSARDEAVNELGWKPEQVTNISAAANKLFQPIVLSKYQNEKIREKYSIKRNYVMYTGGIDFRKNIERLIEAYALLPDQVRQNFQLLIVCKATSLERRAIDEIAKAFGLAKSDLVTTGFVTDDELLTLYNLCSVFIFPSYHEGFGLPALEAMKCGKAAIASNTSSMPEVIGRDDALFDPFSSASISQKLFDVLTDEKLRHELERHSLIQSRKFQWEYCAERAISTLETLNKEKTSKCLKNIDFKPKLAFVSPIPPAKTGIAFYNTNLLKGLKKHYNIEVIVNELNNSDEFEENGLRIREVNWFRVNSAEYDRIVYHFGNSEFHTHMFELVRDLPGVVVLHDFFLSGVLSWGWPADWQRRLYESHGLTPFVNEETNTETSSLVMKYPANLSVLQSAIGIIVHSEFSKKLCDIYYGSNSSKNWKKIPLARDIAIFDPDLKLECKLQLGFQRNSILCCSFGMLAPTKMNAELIEAFASSTAYNNPDIFLVFVGEFGDASYKNTITGLIRKYKLTQRVFVTGWASDELFKKYLTAADFAVQLRKMSRGETSGSILDCMAYSLPTIVNSNGSISELDVNSVLMLTDEFDIDELRVAIETMVDDDVLRSKIGKCAKDIIDAEHNYASCAERYYDEIEFFYNNTKAQIQKLMGELSLTRISSDEITDLAINLAQNLPVSPRRNVIYLDVSITYGKFKSLEEMGDLKDILRSIIFINSLHYDVIPVVKSLSGKYETSNVILKDAILMDIGFDFSYFVQPVFGDIFLSMGAEENDFIRKARMLGVKCFSFTSNIIPHWLESIVSEADVDGIIEIMKLIGAINLSATEKTIGRL